MRRRLRAVVALLLLPGILPNNISRACDECNAVLRGGVFNEEFEALSDKQKQDLATYLATSSYEEVRKSIGAGLKLKTIFKVIPIDFGGNFDRADYHKMQQALTSQHVSSNSKETGFQMLRRYASPEILAAWTKAIEIRHGFRQGLTARFDDPGSKRVALLLSWIPAPGDNQLPVVTRVDVKGGDPSPDARFRVKETLLLGFDANAMVITRVEGEELRVTVQTTKGVASLRLPPPPLDDNHPAVAVVQQYYSHLNSQEPLKNLDLFVGEAAIIVHAAEKPEQILHYTPAKLVQEHVRGGTGLPHTFYPSEVIRSGDTVMVGGDYRTGRVGGHSEFKLRLIQGRWKITHWKFYTQIMP